MTPTKTPPSYFTRIAKATARLAEEARTAIKHGLEDNGSPAVDASNRAALESVTGGPRKPR